MNIDINIETILNSGQNTSSGARITSVAGLPPEVIATLHALNSREPGGFKKNLLKVFKDGKIVERILELFYVGYGHKSIGDCGTGDVFIDGVSILGANHVEHQPLFAGQETSTRYVDLSSSAWVESTSEQVNMWTERWYNFYQEILPFEIEHVRKSFPYTTGKKAEWEKATKARACDITRAFLPGGTRTNFSCHMNLRQFADHLSLLFYHPMREVREMAYAMVQQLQRDHPNSFSHKRNERTEEYNREAVRFIYTQADSLGSVSDWSFVSNYNPVDKNWEAALKKLISSRPPKSEIPKDAGLIGRFNIESLIDYGSIRDLHRHRSAKFMMPVLHPRYGFEKWYLEQLLPENRIKAERLISQFTDWYTEVRKITEPEDMLEVQYATPLGFKVPCIVSTQFDSSVYIAELRSPTTVHPTARQWAIRLGDEVEQWMSNTLSIAKPSLYICREPDQFELKRGKHDIVRRDQK